MGVVSERNSSRRWGLGRTLVEATFQISILCAQIPRRPATRPRLHRLISMSAPGTTQWRKLSVSASLLARSNRSALVKSEASATGGGGALATTSSWGYVAISRVNRVRACWWGRCLKRRGKSFWPLGALSSAMNGCGVL